MVTFEYTRESYTLEAYGKTFEIPTKTAALIDGINDINTRLAAVKNATESVEVMRDGVALFIGAEETERIFPAAKLNEIDTDELSAFWWVLNAEANKATKAVIEKYAPNTNIRKVK